MHLGEKLPHGISKRTCSQWSAGNEICNLGSVHPLVKTLQNSYEMGVELSPL